MSARTTEQLPAAIEHLRAWASRKRIAWVPGMLDEERGEHPIVHFASNDRPPQLLATAEAFSATLDALDVAMLVVSIVTLDEDSHGAAVALYEGEPGVLGPAANEARALVKGLLADVRAARKHIGEPGSVVVAAITRNPTVVIEWSAMAEWYVPIEAAELAYAEMDDLDVGPDPGDEEEWEEIEPEPEPPVPPRRRIRPGR